MNRDILIMREYTILIVITVSRSTWMTSKINGVAIDLFCTGVIDHPRCNVLKLVVEIPSLKQHNWSTKLIRKF